jgi:hypothetical protein
MAVGAVARSRDGLRSCRLVGFNVTLVDPVPAIMPPQHDAVQQLSGDRPARDNGPPEVPGSGPGRPFPLSHDIGVGAIMRRRHVPETHAKSRPAPDRRTRSRSAVCRRQSRPSRTAKSSKPVLAWRTSTRVGQAGAIAEPIFIDIGLGEVRCLIRTLIRFRKPRNDTHALSLTLPRASRARKRRQPPCLSRNGARWYKRMRSIPQKIQIFCGNANRPKTLTDPMRVEAKGMKHDGNT